MAKKRSGKPTIKAEATAKAELVGKATYQRKHTTSVVVPPDVTRAKTGAWLDLISPITEWAGLKGDRLRHKRAMLRIQQEATLGQIAKMARRKIAGQAIEVVPVPIKFLVPFLERASLEDEKSELCDRWSDLLVSAAAEYDPSMIRFSAVLAEIGPGEVNLLNRMARKPRGVRGIQHIEDVPLSFVNGVLNRLICNEVEAKGNEEKLYEAILEKYEYPGTVWTFLGVDGEYFWDFENKAWSEKDEAIASNLVSLGILHLVENVEGEIGSFTWVGRVYAVTAFGLRFLLACDRTIKSELDAYNKAFEESLRRAGEQQA